MNCSLLTWSRNISAGVSLGQVTELEGGGGGGNKDGQKTFSPPSPITSFCQSTQTFTLFEYGV